MKQKKDDRMKDSYKLKIMTLKKLLERLEDKIKEISQKLK